MGTKKKYKIEHYSKKDVWKNARGFGGSSVSALFNKNKYMNAIDIYCSAVAPKETKDEKDTVSTIYGRNAEEPVAKIFALHHPEYDLIYPNEYVLYRRVDKPYMTYTADALLKEKATKHLGIYEGKTRVIQSKEEADEWRAGVLPEQYVLQVLQGLAVINDAKFVVLNVELIFVNYDTGKYASSEIRSFRLDRKDVKKAIKKVEQVQTDFQINHIEKMIPPNLEIEINLGD